MGVSEHSVSQNPLVNPYFPYSHLPYYDIT